MPCGKWALLDDITRWASGCEWASEAKYQKMSPIAASSTFRHIFGLENRLMLLILALNRWVATFDRIAAPIVYLWKNKLNYFARGREASNCTILTVSAPIYAIGEKKPEKNPGLHRYSNPWPPRIPAFQASFPQFHKMVGSRWRSCNCLLSLFSERNLWRGQNYYQHGVVLCSLSPNTLFFIRMLFFRPRLNILIFLSILGWKHSCIFLKL